MAKAPLEKTGICSKFGLKTTGKQKVERTAIMAKKSASAKGVVSEKKGPTSIRLFTFRVALCYKTSIWRDIAIAENDNFESFHDCIFDAFERFDDHLWSFFLPPRGEETLTFPRFGYPQTGYEICRAPEMCDENSDSVIKGKKALLGEFVVASRLKFAYLFDYGDEWRHIITLRKTEEISETEARKYPKVVATHGKAPNNTRKTKTTNKRVGGFAIF